MIFYPLASKIRKLRLDWIMVTRPMRQFSPSDAEAWGRFYVSEQKRQAPSTLAQYVSMIAKHGIPDVGNPCPQDGEDYFLLHEGGFICDEIDRCLRPASTPVAALFGEAALDRLGILSYLDADFVSARQYWADDDIRFALAVSAVEGRWELAGARPSGVVVRPLRKGLIEAMAAPGLLMARMIEDRRRYPPPWSLDYWKRSRTGEQALPGNVEEGPPPPRLDVGKWRSGRGSSHGTATEQQES